ncbi:MAG: hypothetical protein R6V35_00860 [Candidatus Nanohaloarchaea archaeon]
MSKKGARFPLAERGILPIKKALDNHPHSDYTDGNLSIGESLREAFNYALYEKGVIEHGNPVDEDINHPTTFLKDSEWEDLPYTSKESYVRKFENIREVAEDLEGATPLTDTDIEKVREDLETIKQLDKAVPEPYGPEEYLEIIDELSQGLSDRYNTSDYYAGELLEALDIIPDLGEAADTVYSGPSTGVGTDGGLESSLKEPDSFLDAGLNYSMIIPHGIELDYNPAIELALENKQEAVDSYEEELIDFLKEAESANAGYNYVLLSSHYVNTFFTPKYVKKDELFEDMDSEDGMSIEEVLEFYREKEITKIKSFAPKLADLSVPRVSEELMDESERRDLENFIYGFGGLDGSEDWENEEFVSEELNLSLDIARPGPFAVGAHPTLIERNEVLMDHFREEQGLTTKEEIRNDLERVLDKDITRHDVDGFLGQNALSSLYPGEALEEFYDPMIEAAESEDNFIFEINGKGVERQHPSVFWEMLDEYTFGSDSHRSGEQPSRSDEFSDRNISGETVFLADKWISQLKEEL